MIRFDRIEEYNGLRDFLQDLAPREAWCNTGLTSHGTSLFCPYCSRYIEGKEYWDIDYAHLDFKCRWCRVELVPDARDDKQEVAHGHPCKTKRNKKGQLIAYEH